MSKAKEEVVEVVETPIEVTEEVVEMAEEAKSDNSVAIAALESYLADKGESISPEKKAEVEAKINLLK